MWFLLNLSACHVECISIFILISYMHYKDNEVVCLDNGETVTTACLLLLLLRTSQCIQIYVMAGARISESTLLRLKTFMYTFGLILFYSVENVQVNQNCKK